MTHNELCNLYIELSQEISAAHTMLRAACDAHSIQPTNETLRKIQQEQEHLQQLQEQRNKIEKQLQQK